jgi:hypothetical protein
MADGTIEIFDYDKIKEKAKKFGGLVEKLFVTPYENQKEHKDDNIGLSCEMYVNRNKFSDSPKLLLSSYSATGYAYSLLFHEFKRTPDRERFDYYNNLFLDEIIGGNWRVHSLFEPDTHKDLRKLYRFIRWCHAKAKLAEWEIWT